MRNYKRTDQTRELFLPPPFEGEFNESVRPGRFTLPLIEQIRSILQDLQRKDNNSEAEISLSPGWNTLLNYLKQKKVLKGFPIYEQWFTDSPKLYAAALLADAEYASTHGHTRLMAFSRGTSESFEEALSKTVGEFLERYPLMRYQRGELIRASPYIFGQKEIEYLDPASVASFIPSQQKDLMKVPPSAHAISSWVEGRELISNRRTMMPAHLVFWNYCRHIDVREPIVRESNTNGAAGGFTHIDAVVGGIYELIQRDAFMLHWLTNTKPRHVEIDHITHTKLAALIAEVRSYAIEPHFVYLTVDHELPVYACVLVTKENGNRPKVAVGAGAGADNEAALFDALREAITVHRWIRQEKLTNGVSFNSETYMPFRDGTIKQAQRLLLWSEGNMFDRFSWFLEGEKITLSSLVAQESDHRNSKEQELARLIEFFKKKGKGYELFVYNGTNSLLKKVGFHSVKVVIPQLINLYLDETNAPLAAMRFNLLKKLPEPSNRSYKDFNPWPHPFP